jgi:hypothetical protein
MLKQGGRTAAQTEGRRRPARGLEHPQCAVLAWSDTINAAIGPSPIHCGVDSMETPRLCIEPGSKLRPFLSLLPLLLPPPR